MCTQLEKGTYRTVAGQVRRFVPEPAHGHGRESLVVDSVHFDYSSADVTSGFQWTFGKGGPIRRGSGSGLRKWTGGYCVSRSHDETRLQENGISCTTVARESAWQTFRLSENYLILDVNPSASTSLPQKRGLIE
jgi:hypothetical protein